MRPVGFLLRDTPVHLLAREAAWRAQRAIIRRRWMAHLASGDCRVLYRNIPYYRPEAAHCSDAARSVISRAADHVLAGNFALLGYDGKGLGFPPRWNVDFVSGSAWDLEPAGRMKYVRHDGSDVKVPWELSRLQYAPVLAKAYVLTGDERYRTGVRDLISDWIKQNPPAMGVNWAIAMEAALRALSMCWTVNLLWPLRDDEQTWLSSVQVSLWQHLLFIEGNLEYSNIACGNHYLSNVTALLVLSLFFDGEGIERRRRKYLRLVEREMMRQVSPDGGNFESSSGYHVLVLQMFASAALALRASGIQASTAFNSRLKKMFDYLGAIADEKGAVAHYGDCDDGRVELTTDDLEQLVRPGQERNSLFGGQLIGLGAAMFERPTSYAQDDASWYGLAPTAASRTESQVAAVFADSGVAVAKRAPAILTFLNMPNGIGGKGSHTHNDKLSIIVRVLGQELLTDSGTGCYTRDAELRNHCRATSAHNTVQIDGCEQNSIDHSRQHLFCSGNEARVTPIVCEEQRDRVTFRSCLLESAAPGVQHYREVALVCDALAVAQRVEVVDTLAGQGEHDFAVHFNIGPCWSVAQLSAHGGVSVATMKGPVAAQIRTVAPAEISIEKMRTRSSYAYGAVVETDRLTVRGRAQFPMTIRTELVWAHD